MLSREDYIKAFRLKGILEVYNQNFIKNFDEKIMLVMYDIYTNSHTFNSGKWGFLYSEYKDNHDVLMAMLKSGNVPKDIITKIVNDTEIVKKDMHITMNMNRDELLRLLNIVYNDVDEKILETSFKHIKDYVLKEYQFQGEWNRKNIEELNQEFIKYMSEYVINDVATYTKHMYEKKDELMVLTHIRDEEYVKELCNRELTDDIRSYLINNPYITNETRDYIAQFGYSPYEIKIFTPKIANECYTSAIETLEAGFCSKDPEFSAAFFDVKNQLKHMITTKALTEAMQVNLANILIEQTNKKSDGVLYELMVRTESPRVLSLVSKMKGKDKVVAYENTHMPKNLVKQRMNEICKKIEKNAKTNKSGKNANSWYEYLRIDTLRAQAEYEDYGTMFSLRDAKLNVSVATSAFTPTEILKDYIDMENNIYQKDNGKSMQTIATMAKIQLCCREKGLDTERTQKLMEFFRKIDPFGRPVKPYMSAITNEEKQRLLNQNLSYSNKELDSFIISLTKEEQIKFVEYMKELCGTDKDNPEKYLYKYIQERIENYIMKTKEMEEYEQHKDVKLVSNECLLERSRKLLETNSKDYSVQAYYVMLYKHTEELLYISKELKDREDKQKNPWERGI